MRILMTGATGLIGQKLSRELRAEGHETVILTRRPERVNKEPGVIVHGWNPAGETPPAEAWEGVEAVVHLAGEPVAAGRWTEEQKIRIRDSRVTGTRYLVDGMKRLTVPPRVFVSASAVGYYGDRGNEPLIENSDPGTGFLSRICLEWEREAEKAASSQTRVCLIRIGVVLSREGGAIEKMLLPFKLGLGGQLGDGKQWFPWIHLDDIVGLIRHAIFNQQVSGPLNGAAPGIVTNAEFTRQFAASLNRPVFLPVPAFALRLLLGEMAMVVLSSQKVVPRAALETGYNFKYPELEDALRSL